MEIKNVIKIIEDNSEYYEDVCGRVPIVEKYKGEFKETLFKEYISVEELKEVLNNIEIMRSSCGCSESGAKEFRKELLRRLRDARV